MQKNGDKIVLTKKHAQHFFLITKQYTESKNMTIFKASPLSYRTMLDRIANNQLTHLFLEHWKRDIGSAAPCALQNVGS